MNGPPRGVVAILVTSEDTAVAFLPGYMEFLAQRGWRVIVGANSPTGQLFEMARDAGAEAFHIGWERDPAPLSDLRALWKLTIRLRKARPDVVVTATPKAGFVGTLAGFIAGVRLRVYQLWGLRMETSTGLLRSILAVLEWFSIRLSTECVANSTSLSARTEALGLARKGSIQVLGEGSSHGVDVEYFRSAETGNRVLPLDPATRAFLTENPAELTVVFVGRLHPDKGIDTLLAALAACARRGTGSPAVRAVIVGGDEGFAPGQYANDLPPGVIHLTGNVRDVRPYVLSADVLCLPSLREGFPNVVLEAAAMGVPSVVSDATGCIDSVKDGITGRQFPTGDAEALGAIFCALAASPLEISRMGQAARAWAVESFPQERIWDLQASFLEGLLNRKRP